MKLFSALTLSASCVAAIPLAGTPENSAQKPDPNPAAYNKNRDPLTHYAGGNEDRKKVASEVEAEVRRDSRQNYRISGLFEDYEKEDRKDLRAVKGNRNLIALVQTDHSVHTKNQTSVEKLNEEIRQQRDLAVDIHTPFANNEKTERMTWKQLRGNRNMQAMLLQKEKKAKYSWDNADDSSDSSNMDAVDNYLREFGSHNKAAATGTGVSDHVDSSASTTAIADDVTRAYGDSSFSFSHTKWSEDSAAETEDSSSASTSAFSSSSAFGDRMPTASSESMTSSRSSFDAYPPVSISPMDFNQEPHHSHTYGGSVISIPLSSQLQTEASAELQAATAQAMQATGLATGQATSFLQRKNAPGVEEEVAKQKKWDVYLADEFAGREKKDAAEVRRIRGSRDLKP